MKRTYRNDMAQQQKDKIAAANQGKTLSPQTKEKIAQSMRDYWAGLPYKPYTQQPTGNTSGTGTPLPRSPYADN